MSEEELKQQGYTEEAIKTILEGVSSINLSNSPLGPDREDRQIYVTDVHNQGMKTSTLMMGKNKQNILLENGEYCNIDEFIKATEENLSKKGENTKIVSKRTGKTISIEKFKAEVKEELKSAQTLVLGDGSRRIINQGTASISVKGKDATEAINKGIIMLGNKGLNLENGDYIYIGEIKAALDKYMLRTEKIETKQNNPVIKPTEKEIKRQEQLKQEQKKTDLENQIKKAKRKKTTDRIIAAITGIAVAGLIGIGIKDLKLNKIRNTYELYKIQRQMSDEELNPKEQKYMEVLLEKNIGDRENIKAGVVYHESSDYKYGGANAQGEFGSSERPAGSYEANAISIIGPTGEIINKKYEQGINMYEFAKQTCDENNLTFNDIEIMIHYGDPVSGWVNALDLENADKDQVPVQRNEVYHVNVKNMVGQTVDFKTIDGNRVTVPVKDEQGKAYTAGTSVTGTDGKTYKVTQEEQINTVDHKIDITRNSVVHFSAALLTTAAMLESLKRAKKAKEEQKALEEKQKQM